MPENADNPLSFWQELKRRKVIRVITVYAAASFVILELVSIIEDPFGLPDWTLRFVFVILCIGFIISIILSWIYDITPEGIEKTKPAIDTEDKVPEKPSGLNAWKIATYISVSIIVGLIIFHTVGERKQAEYITELEKSIAVLPFHNDSPDDENQYFINGTMEAILDNLCKIKDLKVMARTSVEQYRNAPKQITEIANELNVSYILEGSGQKYGEKIRLTVQLINGENGSHIWSKPYDRDLKDILFIQSEIAQLVAGEVEAIITPEEKQLIEKVPTISLTAFDFYQRGREEYWKYIHEGKTAALKKAEDLFNKSLEYDSTFSEAYIGLAWVYWIKHYWETYLSETFLDSVLILSDIALSYDNQISGAYTTRGDYYRETGDSKQAIEEFDKAIHFNPNEYRAYRGKGYLYRHHDNVKSIENFQKAIYLNRGLELPGMLRDLSMEYLRAGFIEKFKFYQEEALDLDGDSLSYYFFLALSETHQRNYSTAIEFAKKVNALNPTNIYHNDLLGYLYVLKRKHEESLKWFEKYIESAEFRLMLALYSSCYVGWAYWQNGSRNKAEYYFNEQIKYCNKSIELGRRFDEYAYYYLAGVYAFLGDKEKAFENLRTCYQKEKMTLGKVSLIKDDPLFDKIRGEPEFQQIVKDMEAKYQAEHERVRKWLEEQGML